MASATRHGDHAGNMRLPFIVRFRCYIIIIIIIVVIIFCFIIVAARACNTAKHSKRVDDGRSVAGSCEIVAATVTVTSRGSR